MPKRRRRQYRNDMVVPSPSEPIPGVEGRKLYDHPSATIHACQSCGKVYGAPHHLAVHERSCIATEQSIEALLEESKAFWVMRKKRKLEKMALQNESIHDFAPVFAAAEDDVEDAGVELQAEILADPVSSTIVPLVEAQDHLPPEDLDTPVAQRKGKRQTRLPIRFRQDDLPSASSPATGSQNQPKGRSQREKKKAAETPTNPEPVEQVPVTVYRSSKSAFGVARAFTLSSGTSLTHDPDRTITLQDLSDIPSEKGHAGQAELLGQESPAAQGDPSQVKDNQGGFAQDKVNQSDPPQDDDGQGNHPQDEGDQDSSPQNEDSQGDGVKEKNLMFRGYQGDATRKKGKVDDEGPTYGPLRNKSAFALAEWYWNSTNKSFQDFQKLVAIFKRSDFSIGDAISVNWRTAFQDLGTNDLAYLNDASWAYDDGWTTTAITIDVPFHNRMKDKGTRSYKIVDFRHRRILSVIKEKITSRDDSRYFHYYPHHATWMPTEESEEVELYGELYTSRAFRAAHDELQKEPYTDSNRGLERVVVALMLWSDSTQLTSFGPAYLWPCYLFFGNESKYRRCRPSEHLANQIAYFQKLPDEFYDYLKERNNGKIPSDALLAHCTRELYHQQWKALLDRELVNAMKHGVRIFCPDGRERCFYPRIFTYSADYPEKVLLAGVRNNGLSPCHRCLVSHDSLSKLGAPSDTERASPRQESEMLALVKEAQEEILANGYAVDSEKKVEIHLKPRSLVPTTNAFSSFPGHPFDIRQALVVDLMHEFEIGVWKRVFVHGIRLLEAFSNLRTTLTAELDWRYRSTPQFGREAIRKFGTNASDMKRRAARDFEDLLQCAIPAFDSLLPEPHNASFMELLYVCAEWHALAKLRLHNDYTLDFLDYATKRLGTHVRHFSQKTCKDVSTKELLKEAEARSRREGKGKAKGTTARKAAKLGAFTIKFHFLGDYVSTIRWFGTTDSYSTETGELAHRLPKSWYPRTDKRDFGDQMSQIERRQARLSRIRLENAEQDKSTVPAATSQAKPSLDRRYVMAISQDVAIDLSSLASSISDSGYNDQYIVDFIPKLKQHLLPRLLEKMGYSQNSLPPSEYFNVVLDADRIYKHQLLRINYTTYDVRRDEDVIHIDTPQCNVMLLNADYKQETWSTEHPYLYGKCLGIFHANVSFVGPLPDGRLCYRPHRVEFVWLHWYRHVPAVSSLALDRLTLTPLEDAYAVGFIDPADILRGVHVIPQFSLGKANIQPQTRFASFQEHWKAFYINRFADRDLYMRYQYGMSVGHTYMYGIFPPPRVPRLPEDFDYREVGATENDEDDEDTIDGAGGLGVGADTVHIDNITDREVRFFDDMY